MAESTTDITALLRAASTGDQHDQNALVSAIYADLRRLAVSHMRVERRSHTLQPTAVVHEAYLKLISQRSKDWTDRIHFFAVASRLIRRILVDHARRRGRVKRGRDYAVTAIDSVDIAAPARDINLVALDEALSELATINEQQSRIVELRFFGGLTIDELAEVLKIGKRTVDREWSIAKAWLLFRLSDNPTEGGDGR